jgi:hypothetical protein
LEIANERIQDQAGFKVGRMEGSMAYSTGKPDATKEELDAVARQTMGGVQFDPAKGGLDLLA